MKTEQEIFWQGEFGDQYIDRNTSGIGARLNFWSKILARTRSVKTVLEFGPNIGLNLDCIRTLMGAETYGIEINEKAALQAKKKGHNIQHGSILENHYEQNFDLTFTCGVLIHISPSELTKVYDLLFKNSSKYILINEYFNPTPVEVDYRGHKEKLFKRDFAREFMERKDVNLIDYGFTWSADPNFPLDDATWFLFEKQSSLVK